MAVFFECVQCDADFELEVTDVIKDPSLVRCPNCGAKANTAIVESAFVALDEFLVQIKRIQRKFRVGLSLETDEISGEVEEEENDEDVDEDTLWSEEVEEEEDEEDEDD